MKMLEIAKSYWIDPTRIEAAFITGSTERQDRRVVITTHSGDSHYFRADAEGDTCELLMERIVAAMRRVSTGG